MADRRGDWTKMSPLQALAVVLWLALALVSGSAHGASLESQTREALKEIIAAKKEIDAGNAVAADAALKRIAGSLAVLTQKAKEFRDTAVREQARCTTRITELNRQIGEIRRNEEQLKASVHNLQLQLGDAAETQKNKEKQIAQLRIELGNFQNALKERGQKLAELQRWWWVPGYGAYLGIRSLADHDISRSTELSEDLNARLRDNTKLATELQNTQNLQTQLTGQLNQTTATLDQVQKMYGESFKRMQDLRNMSVFLTTADVFWTKADTRLRFGAEGSRGDLELLVQMLGGELTISDFKETAAPQAVTLQNALVDFAASLDQNSNFLLSGVTDYCGGPPRGAPGTIATKTCEIEKITRHFEITDPQTCAFAYVNPPGCPPKPLAVTASVEFIQQRGGSGDWTVAADQNWIGRSRCASPGAVYYGKTDSSVECERICKADSNCWFWTYNQNNGSMPDSVRECWGAHALSPDKTGWGGFISGGLPGRPPAVTPPGQNPLHGVQ